MDPDRGSVTQALQAWGQGDPKALHELTPLVLDELRMIARRHLMRERRNHTLQPTALVNEAYLRLIDQSRVSWQDRAHFFAIAARMMRRVLVDHARRKRAEKRGGDAMMLTFDEKRDAAGNDLFEMIALDDALKRLAEMDPRQGKVVELRFFGGLSVEETGEALGISPATVKREWVTAKAWLYRELSKS